MLLSLALYGILPSTSTTTQTCNPCCSNSDVRNATTAPPHNLAPRVLVRNLLLPSSHTMCSVLKHMAICLLQATQTLAKHRQAVNGRDKLTSIVPAHSLLVSMLPIPVGECPRNRPHSWWHYEEQSAGNEGTQRGERHASDALAHCVAFPPHLVLGAIISQRFGDLLVLQCIGKRFTCDRCPYCCAATAQSGCKNSTLQQKFFGDTSTDEGWRMQSGFAVSSHLRMYHNCGRVALLVLASRATCTLLSSRARCA